MKDLEEIIETTNEYFDSECIPEEWALTDTGEPFRIRTATPREFLDDLITHGFVRT